MSQSDTVPSNTQTVVNVDNLQKFHPEGSNFEYTVITCPAGAHGHATHKDHVFIAPLTNGVITSMVRGTKFLRATCGNTTYSALSPWCHEDSVVPLAGVIFGETEAEATIPNDLKARYSGTTHTDAVTWFEVSENPAKQGIMAYSNRTPTVDEDWLQSARVMNVFAASVNSAGAILDAIFSEQGSMRDDGQAGLELATAQDGSDLSDGSTIMWRQTSPEGTQQGAAGLRWVSFDDRPALTSTIEPPLPAGEGSTPSSRRTQILVAARGLIPLLSDESRVADLLDSFGRGVVRLRRSITGSSQSRAHGDWTVQAPSDALPEDPELDRPPRLSEVDGSSTVPSGALDEVPSVLVVGSLQELDALDLPELPGGELPHELSG